MKKYISLLVVTVCLLSSANSLWGQIPVEIEAIRSTFKKFRSSIEQQNGKEALQYIDTKTLDYYKYLLDQIIYAKAEELDSLDVFDKYNLLTVRHNIAPEKILKLTPAGLYALFVDSGYIAKESVADMEMGKVELKYKEGTAKAQAVVGGKVVPLVFNFVKEKKQWKIILVDAFASARKGLEMRVKQNNQLENEFIFVELVLSSGKSIAPSILEPLK